MWWARCDGTVVWRDEPEVWRRLLKTTDNAAEAIKPAGIHFRAMTEEDERNLSEPAPGYVIVDDPADQDSMTPERRAAIKKWYFGLNDDQK